MNSEKRFNHIFQKYPELMYTLTNTLTRKHPKATATKIEKLLRRSVERRPRVSTRRLPAKKLRQLGRRFTSSVVEELFMCTVCTSALHTPVTLECGHTFCRSCLPERTSIAVCPDCGRSVVTESLKCNVLVQDILARLAGEDELKPSCDNLKKQMAHCYHLRCRNNMALNVKRDISDVVPLSDSPARCRPINTTITTTTSTSSSSAAATTTVVDGVVAKNKIPQLTVTTTDTCGSTVLNISPADLECVLCSRCLFDPVTTACGHTFCRGCLARVLDYGLACPLCMSVLAVTDQARCTTTVLDAAIRSLLPMEHQERLRAAQLEIEAVETDTQVPVFICTSAFPGVACPLYVYEPRYRLLARRCLQSNSRRFAMAAAVSSGVERFATYGTLLEVRDAVHLQDGRSILTTVGLRRFRVVNRGEKDGYDTATVEYIRDQPVSPHQCSTVLALHERVHRKAARWVHSLAPHVQAEIEQSLGSMPAVETNWPSLPDGPAWAWWLMPVLPLSAHLQVGFLSTLSLEKRLRAIDKMLDRMSVRMRAPERNQEPVPTCVHAEEHVESCSYTSERRVRVSLDNSAQNMEF